MRRHLAMFVFLMSVFCQNVYASEGRLFFDGWKFYVPQLPECQYGDCPIPYAEVLEKYKIENNKIYVLSADRKIVYVYDKNKLQKNIELKESSIDRIIEFNVDRDMIYTLSQSGNVYRIDFKGDVIKKSDIKIREKKQTGYGDLSEGGYSFFIYKNKIVVNDIINNDVTCFSLENVNKTTCPSDLISNAGKENILANGDLVKQTGGNHFLRYSSRGEVVADAILEPDVVGSESKGVLQIDESGVYVWEWKKNHRYRIYFVAWEPSNS